MRLINILCHFFCFYTFAFSVKLSSDKINPDVIVNGSVRFHAYNYLSIRSKMSESISLSNCSVAGAAMGIKLGDPADLQVKLIFPKKTLLKEYQLNNNLYKYDINNEMFEFDFVNNSESNSYFQVNSELCNDIRFVNFRKGYYKLGKGCSNSIIGKKQANKNEKRKAITYFATLHPDHIRCNNEDSTRLCLTAATGPTKIPLKYLSFNSYPFLITANQVMVGRSGMIGLNCGPIGLFSSCEAVKWGIPYANESIPYLENCKNNIMCPYKRYKRVFVMSQYDDTQIGQFILESLPRLMYHLDFIYENPDVMIHHGFNKQPVLESQLLTHNFFRMLGLMDRLINDTIYAESIYLPREGGCQDVGYNIWEIANMREKMLGLIQKNIVDVNNILKSVFYKTHIFHNQNNVKKESIILLRRSSSDFTRNHDRARRWNETMFENILTSLNNMFGKKYELILFSDQNSAIMKCPLCQAKLFNDATVVIGMHGAGLTNTIYMNKDTFVVELIPFFDSRHAPITGIFPRLSALLNHHHYSFNYDGMVGFQPDHLSTEIAIFINKIKQLRGIRT